jgi:apolipoprotein N-acyltransferase
MIDASRSPRPRWKQLTMLVVLIGAIAISAWLIWVKELHHTTPPIHAFARLPVAVAAPAAPAGVLT